MSTGKRRWFRVVCDDKGKAVDCRPVGDEGTASLGIFYILATDAKEAARLAGNEQSRLLLAARRARYEAEGRCRCGRERNRVNPAGGFWKDCSSCVASMDRHEERRKLKKLGLDVPKPDRRTVLLERKEQDRSALRFDVLTEVQRAWFKHGANGFERWLGGQLEGVAGKKAS